MSRRRVRKKRFPCAHSGYGVYCHRCAQANKLEQTVGAAENQDEVRAEVQRLRDIRR